MHLSLRASARPARAALAAGVVMGTVGVLAATGLEPAVADTGDTVLTAGLNSDGQLGNGTTVNRPSLAAVAGLADVTEVAGGREHALALVGGQVYAWGDGSKGATGQGTVADRSTPGLVAGLSGVVQITTAHYGSYARLADGTVRSWGYNASGQLGDGTTTQRTSPVTVARPHGRGAGRCRARHGDGADGRRHRAHLGSGHQRRARQLHDHRTPTTPVEPCPGSAA